MVDVIRDAIRIAARTLLCSELIRESTVRDAEAELAKLRADSAALEKVTKERDEAIEAAESATLAAQADREDWIRRETETKRVLETCAREELAWRTDAKRYLAQLKAISALLSSHKLAELNEKATKARNSYVEPCVRDVAIAELGRACMAFATPLLAIVSETQGEKTGQQPEVDRG